MEVWLTSVGILKNL